MTSLEEVDPVFHKIAQLTKGGPILLTTPESTYRAWEMAFTVPGIEFPEPERHWHFKFRKLKEWLKALPCRIRWKIFPYHIIHEDTYEEMRSDY